MSGTSTPLAELQRTGAGGSPVFARGRTSPASAGRTAPRVPC